MDIKKLNIQTLTGLNWGSYELHIQLSSCILDIWDAMCGNRNNTTPITYKTLLKPMAQTHTNNNKHDAATAVWLKKNSMAISLLQGTISPALWPDFANLITAMEIWDVLEVRFGKVGGAQTYLQLVNMITIKMTDSENQLTQIQEFQENYTRILIHDHSTFSKDLVTFTFCSHYHCLMKRQHANTWIILMILPSINFWTSSPEYLKKRITERQTLLLEAHLSTSSPQWRTWNKNVWNVVKWTTALKIIGIRANIHKKAKGNMPLKVSTLSGSGNKKSAHKGKGKEKATESLNVLSIIEILDVNTFSNKSIDFSCCVNGETVEWLLDSGCTEHITPVWSNLHNYKEYDPQGKAEIADGKFITIKGQGNVIGHSLLPDKTKFSMEIRQVLYVPDMSKWLFLLIATGWMNNKSKTTRWGTIVSKNGTPFIIGELRENKVHYFDFKLARSLNEILNVAIITISCDYTLWHRRMGHTHQGLICNLRDNTEGSPDTIMGLTTHICEGCAKGKSRWLPFPPSKSRVTRPLDLVHSHLDEFPVCSIGGFKWSATYLDNYWLYGVMFYLKSKDEEFTVFKAYHAWAKRQTGITSKCKWTDHGEEFLSNEQKTYLTANGIEQQMSIPDLPQQNVWAERFQQTIVNGAKAMWHHTGLANGFWIHAVKVKVHMYNITLIMRAGYKTPTELFRGVKPDISHLWVYGCQAWVHILKKNRSKLEPKSQEMICVGYELGSKGYQFWDAAHQCFKISHDVKFKESIFPAKEMSLAQPGPAPLSDCQFSNKSNTDSDSEPGLVTLDQPLIGQTC